VSSQGWSGKMLLSLGLLLGGFTVPVRANPRRADLKEPLDKALAKIKRNGTYDRINSTFLES
jgi:ABC-type amino acid transport substrate-binding protein